MVLVTTGMGVGRRLPPPGGRRRYGHERDRTEQRWLAATPSSAEAFAEADRLTRAWEGDLRAADLPDRRPRWVRQQWRQFDEEAGR